MSLIPRVGLGAGLTDSRRFATVYTVRWLSLRLEAIASCLVLISATFAVLASQTAESSPGLLGLAVTNAMQVTFLLNYVVELGSEIESQMGAFTSSLLALCLESSPHYVTPSQCHANVS